MRAIHLGWPPAASALRMQGLQSEDKAVFLLFLDWPLSQPLWSGPSLSTKAPLACSSSWAIACLCCSSSSLITAACKRCSRNCRAFCKCFAPWPSAPCALHTPSPPSSSELGHTKPCASSSNPCKNARWSQMSRRRRRCFCALLSPCGGLQVKSH